MANPILVLFPRETNNKFRRTHGRPQLAICPVCKQVYRVTTGKPLACSYACRMQRGFWEHVEKTDTCWIWHGAISRKTGYGVFTISDAREGKRTWLAHRLAYILLIGTIPDGLHLDHLCRTRICVNVAHLEPVTAWENTLRSENFIAHYAHKTHCVRGHAFDDANTRIDQYGHRTCRTCRRLDAAAKRAKQKG